MKNKILIIFLSFFFNSFLNAENLTIQAKNISLDKNKEISIFEKEVVVKTENNKIIKSDYAEYNKKKNYLFLKDNIIALDEKNNKIEAEKAEYDGDLKIFKTIGITKIFTSEGYTVEGENIIANNKIGIINSDKDTIITDRDLNKIFLKSFKYQIRENIFKSIGLIEINDKLGNKYEFSQLYIDTKKKEMIGTDAKAYINEKSFKIDERNKPRIFSNSIKVENKNTTFDKSVFTMCDYRKNDKCPPWSIQAKKMMHDRKKKTIYYNHALIKIYDVPIFYIPRISHPDPSVERRSGFLTPSFSDTKNLGSSVTVPFFWSLSNDKNLTITTRLFDTENPLLLGEYHQAYAKSELIADFGYTKGYKRTSAKKQAGDKSHFFSKFTKNFNLKKDSQNELDIVFQDTSNDKYLKLYKLDSILVDHGTNTLENSIKFSHEENDLFVGFNASVFENLRENYNDKYEYVFPEITLDKNLFSSNKFGSLDLQSNFKAHNYDTNKSSNFLVNKFNWNFKDKRFSNGIKGRFLTNFKNINYESKNIGNLKQDTTSELYGAFGYFSEIDLQKEENGFLYSLKPKFLLRFSPGSMRKETEGSRLDPSAAFSMDRLDRDNNFETGLSSTLGFDYNIKGKNKELDFSVAQILNQKENDKMPSKTSLDEKTSDLVGSSNLKLNDNVRFKYNFSLDENYENFNYNDLETTVDFNPFKLSFNYLLEDKHIGNQEYFKTSLNYNSKNSLISFETKRNLIKDSSEFYNLSYEYINDCLRAGIVYRREFYSDSELETENSLMFRVTLSNFGNIDSPSFNK